MPSGSLEKGRALKKRLGGLIAHADSDGFRLLMTSDAANRLSEGPQATDLAVAKRLLGIHGSVG